MTSVNTLPGTGGTITNTAAAPVTLFVRCGASSTFGGTISDNASGPLSLDLAGSGTMTLTGPSTYIGSTTIRGGSLTLTNLGQLTGTSAVNVNYATLTLDNTGLAAVASRISTATPLNMNGGQLTINARMGNDSVSLGGLNLVQDASIFAPVLFNGNQQTGGLNATFTSLSQSNGAAVNFAPNTGTLGAAGDNAHVFFTAAPALTNSLIGGWATVGGTDFASYNAAQGVGAIGSGGSFPGYSGDAITAGVPADNVN